jgi:hypothetical protein
MFELQEKGSDTRALPREEGASYPHSVQGDQGTQAQARESSPQSP